MALDPLKKAISHSQVCLIFKSTFFYLAQGYLSRKSFARKICKSVYISLTIITKLFLKFEPLFPFELNKLVVAIGNEPAPGDHESSLKNLICKLSLARCPCAVTASQKQILIVRINVKSICERMTSII